MCVNTHSYMVCARVKISQEVRQKLRCALCTDGTVLQYIWDGTCISQECCCQAKVNSMAGKFQLSGPETVLCLTVQVDPEKFLLQK